MMIISSVLTLFLAIGTILYFNIKTIKTRAIQNMTVLSEVIAERSTAALAFMDTQQAEKNLQALRHMQYIELACLYNSDSLIAGQYQRRSDKEEIQCPDKIERNLSKGTYTNNYLILGTEITLDNTVIGYLYILTDDSFVFEEFYQGLYEYTLIILFVILFSLFIANYFQKFISQPILDLGRTARKIAYIQDFSIRAEKTTRDELGDLIDSFNSMLQKTEQYENKLLIQKEQLELHQQHLETTVKKRTEELENNLAKLKNMQGQLIESEKMASLGGLVAGIAHEVNTPIGICLTATSFLKEHNDRIQLSYKAGEMTQDDFEAFLQVANDSSDIILKNIQRATEIIQNFKKVSVDQSVEDKRCFNVKEYFFEIIKSLHPKLKRYNHKIEIISEDQLHIESYPGSFYQIFSNLILNSVIHGFESINQGKIKIAVNCNKEKNQMDIVYQDNGKGMPTKILEKVFEPFVTTKRNKGGTGLGAHIIYNIVTQQLKGKISCDSVVNEGVIFKIEIPVIFCQ